ncbi:protein ALP1-like [Rana temporaria]|uniref:protein ALP1-like n=1 Tax=Rana temporaria TaxID=8407 RepID=UPI001AADF285|nr:protein ALP1-like [Rana temporaria]XP_040205743.1 protein ALP1-like [Rana temporaria]XP_040210145.1 protein ALP1-like [Rana temporaria]
MDPVLQKVDEAIILIALRRQRRRQEEERSRRRHRYWVHPMVSHRVSTGYFHNLYSELRIYPNKFSNFTRMSVARFDDLLERLRPRLTRMDTAMRNSISPEERLLVTLRYLATGQSYATLHHYFLLGVTTVSRVVKETCVAIWEELHNVVMPEPTEEIWESVVDTFWEKTQFPNCIGALDGKHIRVRKPPHSGSSYYNYKKYFSVVLLALSDANLKFLLVDVGAYGSQGDARIFRESTFGRRIHAGQLNIPESRPLPCTEEPSLPLVMVADEAFGLAENLMRPYSGYGLNRQQKVYNYRLSRARRVVECAFGVCTAKWRVLLTSIHLDVENAIKVVLACCVLHNYLRDNDNSNVEPEPSQQSQRVQFMDLRSTARVMSIRNQFAAFFESPEGEVSWQNDFV